ncbi:MAG: primosomal protein N' [Patescibacteria group bacterium]
MQFAEVILHRRVPSRFESFTYEVPPQLAVMPGQIVQVPFRNQKLSAIVRRLHQTPVPYAVKPIEAAQPVTLPPWQMELASWMSEHYACAFSKVIDLFIPEKIWEPGKRKSPAVEDQNQNSQAAFSLPIKQNPDVENIIKKCLATGRTTLLIEKTPLPRKTFYDHVQRLIPKDSQALFLFPEIFSVLEFGADLPKFHSELNETQKAKMWNHTAAGEVKAIAGSRGALFLPFKNLSCIVVDFEDHESYHELRQPHYDAVEVAQKISQLLHIPLIIISRSPRTETWHQAVSGTIEKCEWDTPPAASKVNIMDMANERRKGNQGFFAEKTLEQTAKCLAQNEQILFFVNRRGEASALLCSDCGNITRCAKCAGPLTLHTGNELQCHRCKLHTPVPSFCASCKSVQLKKLGAGTQRLEKEMAALFGKASIVRIDRETVKDGWPKEKIAKADIIIATQIIDKPLDLPRLKLAVVVFADALLDFEDFRAGERAFQMLTHLQFLAKEHLFIQTFIPEQELFGQIQNGLESFYNDELATRKSLSLPPFDI